MRQPRITWFVTDRICVVNDEDFRQSQKDFASFIRELSTLVTEKDYTIPELPSKDIVCLESRSPVV